MDIAGHVSKRMLRHYSHIRMEAKRTALESIVKKQPNSTEELDDESRAADVTKTVGYSTRIKTLVQIWSRFFSRLTNGCFYRFVNRREDRVSS